MGLYTYAFAFALASRHSVLQYLCLTYKSNASRMSDSAAMLRFGAIGVVVGRRLLGYPLSVRQLLYWVSVAAWLAFVVSLRVRCRQLIRTVFRSAPGVSIPL